MSIGMTGKSVTKRKILILNDAEKDTKNNLSSDIDNFLNVQRIRNIMIGPILDMQGNIRGIIQFINKKDKDKIDQNDEIELQSILPALGEIIKTADETLKITNISLGLQLSLDEINENITQRTQAISDK